MLPRLIIWEENNIAQYESAKQDSATHRMSAEQLQCYQVAPCLCLCFAELLALPYEGAKQCNRLLEPSPRKNHVETKAVKTSVRSQVSSVEDLRVAPVNQTIQYDASKFLRPCRPALPAVLEPAQVAVPTVTEPF